MGMDSIFKSQPRVLAGEAVVEGRRSKILPNGWKIDGKMDLVDYIDDIIYDWKGMSASAYTKFKGNKKDHRINMQMAVYNWLVGGDFKAEAHVFITDWDPVKDTHPASAYQIVDCKIYSPLEIEAQMVAKTDELASWLHRKKTPPKCEDVMPRFVRTGEYINSKCAFYCSYAHVCPRKRDDTAKTLGLSWGKIENTKDGE